MPNTGLIDLEDCTLTELLTTKGGTVFDESVRKVANQAEEHPQKAVSAFNSAV